MLSNADAHKKSLMYDFTSMRGVSLFLSSGLREGRAWTDVRVRVWVCGTNIFQKHAYPGFGVTQNGMAFEVSPLEMSYKGK